MPRKEVVPAGRGAGAFAPVPGTGGNSLGTLCQRCLEVFDCGYCEGNRPAHQRVAAEHLGPKIGDAFYSCAAAQVSRRRLHIQTRRLLS